MQAVNATFTAESRDRTRKIAASEFVSWKKSFNPNITFFQIGVSSIGGTDIIGSANAGDPLPEWLQYQFFDESEYIMALDYERTLRMPVGGLAKALADGLMDNTSGRFTPNYAGGNSELATAVVPRRPVQISAGFNYSGIDHLLPQFVGLFTKQPEIDLRRRQMRWQAADFVDFLSNRYVDQTSMFTGQRTDQVLETLLAGQGLGTAQYQLDFGLNTIPFGLFETGTKLGDIINDLVEAEMGHFYQDEMGVLRFENRQHWGNAPHTTVQTIIYTADVIDAKVPDEDHLINVVEVKSKVRAKQPRQLLFKLGSPIDVISGEDKQVFVNFDDPVIQAEDPVVIANTDSDGSGSSLSVTLRSSDVFAHAAKYVISVSGTGYITDLQIWGRPARVVEEINYRQQDDSSVTAFEERRLTIDNNYIQSRSLAETMALRILEDFSEIENIQQITIRAKPQLQLGDLISWQGRYWITYGIKTIIDPSYGFVQELDLLQRTVTASEYFTIGASTIGGDDIIAP